MPFYGPGRPGKTQSRIDGCAIVLDAMGEADEWGKSTGNRIVQPAIQVTNAAPCDQSTEALEQAIAGCQALVFFESDLQSPMFLVVELLRWPEAEPAQVEAFDPSRSATPPP